MKNSEIKACFFDNRVHLEALYLEHGGSDGDKLMSYTEVLILHSQSAEVIYFAFLDDQVFAFKKSV